MLRNTWPLSFLRSRDAAAGGAASSTKWRILVNTTSQGFSGFGEIEFRATSGGADQCTGGTPTAKSIFDGSHTADKGCDDDINTLYHPSVEATDCWWQYEKASPFTVTEVALRARNDTENDVCPRIFSVQYWNASAGVWQTSWSPPSQSAWSTGEQRIFTKP